MKKFLAFIFLLAFMFSVMSTVALAAGDKVRGENSEGPSYQNCVENSGDCPYNG